MRAFTKSRHRFNPPPTNRILVQAFPDETTAFMAEQFLIYCYGRINAGTGCLRNLTDGGLGGVSNKNALGAKRSAETRKKLSIANLGRKRSPEVCKAVGDFFRGKPWSTIRRDAQDKRIPRPVYREPCHCGKPFHAKGMCAHHYYKDYDSKRPNSTEIKRKTA